MKHFITIFLLLACKSGNLTVSMLLESKANYEGKQVSVAGYYVNDFEDHALYESKSDSKESVIKNSIWIESMSPNVKCYDRKNRRTDSHQLVNMKVLITGTFNGKLDTTTGMTFGYGHMNVFPGQLKEITEIKAIN